MPTKPNPAPVRRMALTVPEAAESIGIGASYLYKLARQGKLALVRLGGRTLVRIEDVNRLLEDGKTAPTSLKGKAALAVRVERDAKTKAA